ncbi:MAG TPA: hypothetical protein VEW03_16305 [Longimicrobiaceae bacterium]|nr:hypothetical protein [Longimicrobiaceae bacterium]
MNWRPRDYDRLERAIAERRRIRLVRGGSELTVLPERLATDFGMEVLAARHLGTGDRMEVGLDEIDAFDVLG